MVGIVSGSLEFVFLNEFFVRFMMVRFVRRRFFFVVREIFCFLLEMLLDIVFLNCRILLIEL